MNCGGYCLHSDHRLTANATNAIGNVTIGWQSKTAMKPRSDLKRVKGVKNLRQAKEFLRLSWRELAEKINKPKRGHYSHSELIAWADDKRTIPDAVVRRVGQLIATALSQRYGREIALSLEHNSPWKIKPVIWCGSCRKWHELKRWNQKTHNKSN